MALQHLRSSTANKRPTAGAMADGQLAINTESTSPGVFFKNSAGGLVKIGPVHVGTTAPNASPASGGAAGNTVGEQWLDTSSSRYVFKIWDGSAWRSEAGEFVDVAGDVMTGALGIIAGSAASPGVYFSGDTNTGIYSPGADQVAVSTGGTGRLFVDASGNVGLVSAPSAFGTRTAIQLNGAVSNWFAGGVNGFTLFSRNLYNDGVNKFIGSSYASNYYQNTSGEHIFEYSSASGTAGAAATMLEAMRITNAGRLGLGTTSPGDVLEVTGNIRLSANAGSFRNIGAASASNTTVVLQSGSASGTGGNIELNRDESIIYDGSFHIFRNTIGSTEYARIDTSGRLLVGTSTARNFNNGVTTPRLQLEGLDVSQATFSLARNSANSGGPVIGYGKSRGTVAESMTAVLQNDDLGRIQFQGADGTQLQQAAEISAHVDGTPGANDMPGRLVFSTTADGANSPTERLRITSAGRVGIGTADPLDRLHIASTGECKLIIGNEQTNTDGIKRSAIIKKADNDLEIRATESAAASATIFTRTVSAESARIDSSGRLLVGTSTARTNFYNGANTAQIQLEGTNFQNAAFAIVCNANSDDKGSLILAKNRGATVGSNTVVQDGDDLGSVEFQGSDGTEFVQAANIKAEVDGTPGANDMPGRIVLSVTTDGASSPTEALRITNDRVVAYNQPDVTSKAAAATLTVAELKTKIIQYTGAAATLTLPTGTLTEGGFSGIYTNMTFEWSVINTGSGLCTIGTGTGHTIVGGATVAAGASGRFASRRTAANTFVTYRLS